MQDKPYQQVVGLQQVAVIVQQVQTFKLPVATAGYGTVTHIVLTDSATYGGGNVILIQALTSQVKL